MWKALTNLFQSNNDHRKLALKDKLMKIKMEKGDTILKYLTKFVQCRDEIRSIRINVADDDLVSLDFLGLPKCFHSDQDSINGREKNSRLGTTLVRFGARTIHAKYEGWIFI